MSEAELTCLAESRGPDFLCVGARKTGTTWLYHFLRRHPSVSMPIVKELGFFNDRMWSASISKRRRLSLLHRKSEVQRSRHRPRFEAQPHLFPDPPSRGSLEDALNWYTAFFDLARNEAAASRGGRASQYLSGDISPLYQNMSREQMDLMRRYFPDVKVIYIIRDPIKRLWSDFIMEFSKEYEDLHRLTPQECVDLILGRTIRGALHAHLIERWKAAFGSRFSVLIFDDLMRDPVNFASRICSFLDIPELKLESRELKNPNPGQKIPIPTPVQRSLSQTMLPEIMRLHDILRLETTGVWLRDAKKHAFDRRRS